MSDPSHPEGQSPVQPTCDVCGRAKGRNDNEVACGDAGFCWRDWWGPRAWPLAMEAECYRLGYERLRAELAQQKQFGLDRLAQHVEEEQAAHAENATLRAQLSEKEAEIARLKEDEWRAWGDCRDGKCNACPKCCDAARAAQAKAEQERDEALRAAFEGEGK